MLILFLQHGHYVLVRHFNYTSWPEHGVPDSCSTLIKFVKAVRAHRHDNTPIVVHCRYCGGLSHSIITVCSVSASEWPIMLVCCSVTVAQCRCGKNRCVHCSRPPHSARQRSRLCWHLWPGGRAAQWEDVYGAESGELLSRCDPVRIKKYLVTSRFG